MKVTNDFKMVIVVDQDLPIGLISNTAAVLSLSIGNKIDGLIDKDLTDASGTTHIGLTNQPLPILKTTEVILKEILKKAKQVGESLLVIDITDAAQTTKNYADYEEKLKGKRSDELKVLGIALAGPVKQVKKLTGNLGLLR